MTVLALQGIRGGAGVTSIAAALAWALRQGGDSVLVIDFSQYNMLRLHFNMPFDKNEGWMRSSLDNLPWQNNLTSYIAGLDFLPYGQTSYAEQHRLRCDPQQHLNLCQNHLNDMVSRNLYDWIILDLDADYHWLGAQQLKASDLVFFMMNPDLPCQIRLHQKERGGKRYYLLNRYAPASRLQNDLCHLWMQTLPDFLPVIIHADEAVAEALAVKKPLGEYSAHSLAGEDINDLARWCITHSTRNRV